MASTQQNLDPNAGSCIHADIPIMFVPAPEHPGVEKDFAIASAAHGIEASPINGGAGEASPSSMVGAKRDVVASRCADDGAASSSVTTSKADVSNIRPSSGDPSQRRRPFLRPVTSAELLACGVSQQAWDAAFLLLACLGLSALVVFAVWATGGALS